MNDVSTIRAVGGEATTKAAVVAVAICTYRRPGDLARTLEGLAGQTFPAVVPPRVHVVVVDNEGDPRVRSMVETFDQRAGIPARYAVEPRRGISQARNRALALIPDDAEFVAFIDDDEAPEPGWLQALLATRARTGAAVVCGPVFPDFDSTPPAWVTTGEFFNQPRRPSAESAADGCPVPDASTNNALVDLEPVRRLNLRFDERFGLSGGEDALFFRQLSAAGARMVWSPDAVVRERVPVARARFGYLMREYFRCGNVRAALERLDGASTAITLRKGLKKTLIHGGGLLAALTRGGGRAQVCGQAFELANAAGRLCAVLGVRYQHYR